MGLFGDMSRFLEERLDEFLKKNPHLELQVLEDQLIAQERETKTLIASLDRKEKQLQDEIMAIAEEIQRWHPRIAQAVAAGRQDLAQAAQEREATLLSQGNRKWGEMAGTKQSRQQSEQLLQQIQERHQELKAKIANMPPKTAATEPPKGWNYTPPRSTAGGDPGDPLEEQFQRWEMDQEIERLKRDMR